MFIITLCSFVCCLLCQFSARMWLGCIVFSLIVLPIGFLQRFLPVPEVCCIPALAGGRPKGDSEDVDDIVDAEAGHSTSNSSIALVEASSHGAAGATTLATAPTTPAAAAAVI